MQHLSDRQPDILTILENFHGIEPLRKLFWTELNYNRENLPLPYQDNNNDLATEPLLWATGGVDNAFHVIYAQLNSDRLLLTAERRVITQLLKNHLYALFIFSNRDQTEWHIVNVRHDADDPDRRRLYRRITIRSDQKLRTASERIAMLDLASIDPDDFDALSPLPIQARHDEAFNVEAVTARFFEDYKAIFQKLQEDLTGQTNDSRWAHDYALQFLNRCMFLYFIQRKGWLGEETEFLRLFWESYQDTAQPANSFVDKWLNLLFFEAFNNRFHGGHHHFPDDIREALAVAPYLNGGLFTENNLDREYNFQLSDARFEGIFDFFEGYNFTIAEDSPLDQEVAVDPEMIGKVYESLVNVSTEVDERGDAGIFYTPRTEIDLMCRLALVDNLTNHLGETHKDLLYEAIFTIDPDEKAAADEQLTKENLWESLDTCLRKLVIVDPACGSGSFLVGMLHVLDDLRSRANQQLGREESSYDRKKSIIGHTLYGVDVMEWACHVAELRLWLSLIIDTDFSRAELQVRKEALLPNFSFNIRCGDSLVQEIGGLNLAQIRADFSGVPSGLKRRVTNLKKEKLKFFNNDPECRYKSKEGLEHEELQLFRTLVDTRTKDIKQQIDNLQQRIDGPKERQMLVDGTIEKRTARQLELQAIEWQKEIDALTEDLNHLARARIALVDAKDVPFVWNIAFVEIFTDDITGEKRGFDIVIGNPPYVRQENISDPTLPREQITVANKKAYKAKLARSVYQAFSWFFDYKRGKDRGNPSVAVSRKLDAKSDLYIYFYFHGLSLLNPKGAFCFITSNSWLDVGYGKDLQEFTLKHCHIKQIIDNQVRRSFASADVNTVICLFSAPDPKVGSGLDQTTRFVTCKVPFEGVIDAVFFYEIETAAERVSTQEHRIFPVSQGMLLEAGADAQRVNVTPKTKYTGDKWGGKYLRAPDIYWTVLEKGKDKLVRLGDVAEVRFGIKTGANEFFYLDAEGIDEWEIEDAFLKPVIFSLRELICIEDNLDKIQKKIFRCHEEKSNLIGTNALEYIEWGESQSFNERPSCRSRQPWYSFAEGWNPAPFIFPAKVGERMLVLNNLKGVLEDKKLYGITPFENHEEFIYAGLLNSTLVRFFMDLSCRQLTGGQAIADIDVRVVKEIPILPIHLIADNKQAFKQAYDQIKSRPIDQRVAKEYTMPDRRALDTVIFDILNLTQGERDGVYEAVVGLVEARLKKAKSLKE